MITREYVKSKVAHSNFPKLINIRKGFKIVFDLTEVNLSLVGALSRRFTLSTENASAKD